MIFLNQKLIQQLYLVATALMILSGGYLALAGSTVELTTVQWDEFTDLVIASTLSERPLRGHSWDGSQARFPMYVTAAANQVMQMFNPDIELLEILPVSRWISILMTVLAIWGTFILGYRLFNITTGLLAGALFALSPFTLSFGSVALTQGDAFTATTVVFTLIAFERFDSKRNTLWLAYFSFFLALMIATKFFLVILIPALFSYHLIIEVSKRYQHPDLLRGRGQLDKKTTVSKSYIALTTGVGFLALLALTASLQRIDQSPPTSQVIYLTALLGWLVTLLGIFFSFLVAFKNTSRRWSLIGAWMAILPLTFAIVLALFPAHIFNPNILPVLLERFITMDGNSNLLATTSVSAKLYFGLILFKLGLPFGIATCLALIWTVRNSVKNKALLLIVLILFYYGILLLILPLQQPFWLMSIYPLITLILSVMIVQGLTEPTKPKPRLVWVAFVVFAFGWLAVGLFRVYPTFGYYGYELVGTRWLGIESQGYRALVTVTNDGSTEAIDWLRQNAPSESIVLSFLDDSHIINYLNSIQAFTFELKHAISYQDKNDVNQELLNADFVVIRAIDDIRTPLSISEPTFIQQFGSEPAHQIFRGQGIYRMPVIQIYQRVSQVKE